MPVVFCCGLVAIAVFCLMQDQPSDVGLKPYGDHEPGPAAPSRAVSSAAASFFGPFLIWSQLARSQTFWILAGTFFICGLSTNGLIQTHFIALCSDRGLGPVPAASVLSMMGLFDLVGTTLSGYLSDRYDNRRLLFWYYGLRGLSLFVLPYSSFSLYGLSVFAMFYGLDWIATVPPTAKLVAQRFGKERAGLVFGWVFAAHQLGAAVAAYGAGLTRTLLLTYTPALLAAGAACLLAAVAAMLIRRPALSAPLSS
jgi:sugar phosphate permease